jgi:hypothetical protein
MRPAFGIKPTYPITSGQLKTIEELLTVIGI